VLAEITLPNGLKYTFNYNTYGEITKITLPTGGYYRYDYAKVDGFDYNIATNPLYGQANRGVTARYVCETGACTPQQEQVWQYSATHNSPSFTYLMTSITDPFGTKTERYQHMTYELTYFGYDNARSGHAYDERTYNASGQMLRRTLTEWTVTQSNYAERDARPIKEVSVILDTGGNALASITTTNYDADLNEIAINRYDHVSIDPTIAQTGNINSFPLGTLLRTEESTFLINDTNIPQATRDAYRARHLIALPSYTRVKNGTTIFAETQLKYDEPAYPVLTYDVTPPGWSDPPGVRGNVTTTRRWLNVNGSYIETHSQYDQFGNLRKAWDGNGKITETLYADSFSDDVDRNTFAYATSVITPIPDPTGNFGSNQPLTSSSVFEFNTGKVVTTTDANNRTTAYSYLDDSGNVDPLIRLRKVTLPDGLGETKYEYGDAPGDLYIRTLKKQNATTWLEDRINFDAMARACRSGHYEGSGSWSVKDTEYDSLGRVKRVTNPYFADDLSGATPDDAAWTATDYDALGRVIRITTPDDAQVNTQYSGNQVTVTDQAGKKRQSKTDALGRLTEVIEDPGGWALLRLISTTHWVICARLHKASRLDGLPMIRSHG
jgi:YD repeat-containing protein